MVESKLETVVFWEIPIEPYWPVEPVTVMMPLSQSRFPLAREGLLEEPSWEV